MSSTAPVYDFKYYHYSPSKVAAIIFVALFGISTIFHIYQLFRRRTWYFVPFVIGGCFEAIGYLGRVLSANETPNWTLGPYIIQSLLLLVAPAFFAASIYMILGRIIHLVDGEAHSVIRARWLTKIFVAGDVISFFAQAGGGGMLARAESKADVSRGENIITGGLGIQVLFFGVFIIVAGIFHYRITRFPTTRSRTTTIPWQKHLLVLYFVSLLIFIRSSFRIVEYVMGQNGALLDHELYLYVFDATLMFLVTVVLNISHPSQIITMDSLRDHDIESDSLQEQQSQGVHTVSQQTKY